jgi:hypothetical protein
MDKRYSLAGVVNRIAASAGIAVPSLLELSQICQCLATALGRGTILAAELEPLSRLPKPDVAFRKQRIEGAYSGVSRMPGGGTDMAVSAKEILRLALLLTAWRTDPLRRDELCDLYAIAYRALAPEAAMA